MNDHSDKDHQTHSSEETIASILLTLGAVVLRPHEPFTFSSGIKSPIYCDNRLLLGFVKERKIVVDAFLEKIKQLNFDVVGGTATAGIAWGAWIAQADGKPMIYIR